MMSAERPTTIGITRSLTNPRDPTIYGDYGDAIERAGGRVRWLRPGDEADLPTVLAEIDGLLLSGGADVDPAQYGEAPHPKTELSDGSRKRDALEMPLTRLALERDLPVLAICRGLQVLNVALGGTLHQHVEGHRAFEDGFSQVHEVHFNPSSRIAQMLAIQDTLDINSRHHQALKAIAPGLEVTAYSPDRIVEALESPLYRWVFGVQCHPERSFESPPEFEGLFTEFVRAAASTVTPQSTQRPLSV